MDLADLIGLYFVIQRVAGKGQVKVLTAGLGWAFAELVLTRVIFLWVGARGIEFDWKYIQNSFEANTWYSFGHVVKSRRVLSPFFSLSISFALKKVPS